MTLSSLILKAVLLGVLGALDSGRSTRACSVPDIRGKNGSEPRKVIKVNSGNNKRLPCWIKIIDPNQTLKYYWLKDNQTLSGGHQRTVRRSQFIIRYLRIRKAKKEDAGFYTCVVVSDCGESNHTIQLIVKEAKTCKVNQFTCADKSCISLFWKCDGRHDCHDRSDENGCPTTAPLVCSKEMFRCDGDCIQGHLQCDGKNDCADGSDERGCAAPQLRRLSPPRLVEQMRQKEVKLICNIQQLHLQMF